jgi:hypothetical protein
MTMDDDLEQLLKALNLRRILAVLSRELERAEKNGSSHTDLLRRLLREECER